ncbi:MAG: PaaI family thioesterase [Ectothiorhodospiraceae bacterium]|nr:PaaI family thioesterase [Ectothiorhodospiraceae bacterium]
MPSVTSSQVERVRATVQSMPIACNLGLKFLRLCAGEADVEIPVQESWSYRPGHLQAAAVFAAADFAAVAAAGTLLPAGAVNATVDGSLKLLAPATGARLIARGRVVHAGSRTTACAADVYAVGEDGTETLCATFLGSARNLAPRETQA